MNAADLICPHCGRKNSFYRFWCESCQATLAQPGRSILSDASAPAELERKQLYGRVLVDLNELVQSHEVSQEDSAAIRSFYRTQLGQIEEREAKLAKALSIDNLIRAVRNSAQEGHFQQAIQTLRAGAQEHPGAFPFEQMVEELDRKDTQERAARETREAKDLLSQSRTSLLLGRFDEAQQKLSRASELDPSNEAVRVALAEIHAKISEANSAAAMTPTQVGDPVEDEVVTARLVEPDDGPGTESDSKPVEAEAVKPDVVLQPFAAADAAKIPSSLQSPASETTPPPPAVRLNSSARRSFEEVEDEVPNPTQRLIDAASRWSTVLKPFLVDNVGWFVGAFLVIAGFVVLIVSFWGNIEQNRILMHSLVFFSLAATTGIFFAMAYFMRLKYPQLESSSNVLLVIVSLLIPLVFAAAVLTTLVPGAPADAIIQASMG